MKNKKMLDKMKKSGVKSIVGILLASNLLSMSVPAFADSDTPIASVSDSTVENAQTTESSDSAAADTEGNDSYQSETNDQESDSDVDGTASENIEDSEADSDSEEESSAEENGEKTETSDEGKVDEEAIEQAYEKTTASYVADVSKIAVSSVCKMIPGVGIMLSSYIDYAYDLINGSGSSQTDVQLKNISNQLDTILAQMQKDANWQQFAASVSNLNTNMDAVNAAMKTDCMAMVNLDDAKKEYLTDIALMDSTSDATLRAEYAQKAYALSARIMSQNTFTSVYMNGNSFWAEMELLKTYILGTSCTDTALSTSNSAFDKAYDYQKTLNSYNKNAADAASEYQKKIFTLYTAINTYTITCLENQKAYTYNISEDAIAIIDKRIAAMQEDMTLIASAMGECVEREYNERNMVGDKVMEGSEYAGGLTKDSLTAAEKWTGDAYKDFLTHIQSDFSSEDQTDVRTYLSEKYGISFPSGVRYVRVSDFTTGKCQTIITAATSSNTILWCDVYADVIDLSASELTISKINVGQTGITVNGKSQYQKWSMYNLGEITIG